MKFEEDSFSSDFFDFIKSNNEMFYNYSVSIPLYYKEFLKFQEALIPKLDSALIEIIFKNSMDRDIDQEITLKIFEEKLDSDFSFFDVIDIVDSSTFQYDTIVLSSQQHSKICNSIDRLNIEHIMPTQFVTKRYVDAVNSKNDYYTTSYCGIAFKVFPKFPNHMALFSKVRLGSLYYRDCEIPLDFITLEPSLPSSYNIEFLFNVKINPNNYLLVEL